MLVIGLAFMALPAQSASAPASKLRVTHIPGAPVYRAPVLGQPIAILPLNSILDAEVKQGEFWKVTILNNGVKTTGYIHEFLVDEVKGSEAEEASAAVGSVRSPGEFAAQLTVKIEEYKRSIYQEKDLAIMTKRLRLLISDVFSLEDRQKQKQVACEIYFWIGTPLLNRAMTRAPSENSRICSKLTLAPLRMPQNTFPTLISVRSSAMRKSYTTALS
jgi:hypothetical protein